MKTTRLIGLFLSLLLFPSLAFAEGWEDKIEFSGSLSSDIRFIIENNRGEIDGEGYEFELNRNELKLRLEMFPVENVRGVAETLLRFDGYNNANNLQGLTKRSEIDPYEVQLNEAYLHLRHEYAEVRVGRFAVNWGTADQFNPTDVISPRDFSDSLEYSVKVPNQMIEAKVFPTDFFNFTVIWVPVFKPSQLPPSAVLGFAPVRDPKTGEMLSFPAPPLKDYSKIKELQDMALGMGVTLDETAVNTIYPKSKIANSQAAAKAQFQFDDIDFSFSYYYGRFSFPQALTAYAYMNDNGGVNYDVEVMYPRMHMAGFDMSYPLTWLFDIGFRAEAALYFPEEVTFGVLVDPKLLPTEITSHNISGDPIFKATVGLDYTFTAWFYMNAMYVRGFIDEFDDLSGLHNYVVSNIDFKFFEDELQIKLAGVLNVDDLSATLFPQMTWVVVPSVEVIAGTLIFLGDTMPDEPLDYAAKSKFGQKPVGRSIAFLKAKLTF